MKKRTRIGVIGGIVYVVLTLPNHAVYFVPQDLSCIFSCWACLLPITIFPAVGAFTAASIEAPCEPKEASKDSAVAGFIAGSIFGAMTFINSIIVTSLRLPERYLQQLPPESQEILTRTGIDSLYSFTGQITVMICAIPITIGVGVLLSTLSGLVYSSIREVE
jgi:hypothetical protein